MDAGTSSILQQTVVGTNSTRRKKNYSRRPLNSIDTATTQVHKKEIEHSDATNCNIISQNSNSIEKMEREPADSKQPNFRRRRSSKKSEKTAVDSSANANTNQGVTNNFSSYRIISRLQMTDPSIENNRDLESVHNPETNSNSPQAAQTHSLRSSKQIKSRNERTRPTMNELETNMNPSDPLINTRVAQQKSYIVDSSIETAETSVHRKEFDPLPTRDVPSQKRSRQRKRNPAPIETSVHTNSLSLNPTAPAFIPTTKSSISRSTDSVVVTVPVPTQSSITCTICAEENIPFLAVGPCNHPICSMCALRIRFKTKSFDCPICKSLMDVMVVFPHARSAHDYFSFSLPDDEWVYTCPPYPGTELLSVARMIFFDCRDHLKSFEKLISICCPLKDCGRMFPSNRRLLDHLNHQHMGLTICNICLDHRQLFIPEHKVVTKSELKQHMNGTKDSVQSNDPSSSLSIQSPRGAEAGDTYFTQGHPRCEFCRSHYFDSSALFSHMQSAHETCHLCPGRMMFRYYRNIASIQQHYRKNHIVCESCYEIEERRLSGEAVAFNTYSDYSTHMTEYHGLSSRDCRIRFENSLQRQTGSSSYAMSSQQQDAGFFDLDMGTANPYYVPSNSNVDNNNRNSNNTGGNHSNRTNIERTAPANSAIRNVLNSTSSNASISIPPNMQIAGRITGSGRFTAKSESDLLMQAMAEEQANAIKKEHRIMNQWAFKNIRQPDSFPELAVSKGTATASLSDVPTSASAQSSSSTTPHPLSLVNSKQKSILEKKVMGVTLQSLSYVCMYVYTVSILRKLSRRWKVPARRS